MEKQTEKSKHNVINIVSTFTSQQAELWEAKTKKYYLARKKTTDMSVITEQKEYKKN